MEKKYALFEIVASTLQPVFSLLYSMDTDTVLLDFINNKVIIRALSSSRTILLISEVRKSFKGYFTASTRGGILINSILVNPKLLYKYIEKADKNRTITFRYDKEKRELILKLYFKEKGFDVYIQTLTTKPEGYQWLSEIQIEKPKKYIAIPKDEFAKVLLLLHSVKIETIEFSTKNNELEIRGLSQLDRVNTTLRIISRNEMQVDKVKIKLETNLMKELYQLYNVLHTDTIYLSSIHGNMHLFCEGTISRAPVKIYIIISEML